MCAPDLECVLLHEITHAQKRHVLFYLMSALSFSVFSVLAQDWLDLRGVPIPVVAALMESPARDWTVETLADVGGMSRSAFARKVRDLMGVAPPLADQLDDALVQIVNRFPVVVDVHVFKSSVVRRQ